jgi:hypothetical protein
LEITMKRLLMAGALVAGSLIPSVAMASHPSQICLDLEPGEVPPTPGMGDMDVVTAYPGATDAGHPPQHEGCVTGRVEPGGDWGATNIDFEITGVADPDSSDSPSTPDMTCTVAIGNDHCDAYPPAAAEGTQTIRGWLDFDLNDATVEADTAEGYDETAAPGDSPEPDATDVVVLYRTDDPCFDCVYVTTVTIDYREGTFAGRLSSDEPSCIDARSVKIFKIRGGHRILKGRTESESDGRWEIDGFKRSRGRFFAVAPYDEAADGQLCSKGRSPTIWVGS